MLIVGTGAVATLLAERFFGCGVRFRMFGGSSERLRVLEDRFPGCTVGRPSDVGQHSRWIVALKTHQNAEKAQLLHAVAKPKAILVLQNGLNPQDDWQPLALRVDRALSTYGVRQISPGRIEGGGVGEITLPQGSPFSALLNDAGFCLNEAQDMTLAIWQKLAVNASLNVVASLFGVKNGRVLEIPEALRRTKLASLEVAEVARALGIFWGSPSAWELTRAVAQGTAGNICSTLADIRLGRPTEYQAINGEILATAERLKVAVPILERLDRDFRNLVVSYRRTACA